MRPLNILRTLGMAALIANAGHTQPTDVNGDTSTLPAIGQPTLTALVNQLPYGINISFQLTDGTVMAQDGGYPDRWWKLTPDINGSYVNGTWVQLASLPYAPDAFSSAVLADGRVLVVGGEYTTDKFVFTLTNQGAIYDPKTDVWTPVQPPTGWAHIGDSPNTVLPDGTFLLGAKLTKQMSLFDPKTMSWKSVGSKGKSDFNAEEGWTLLPNGSVLTADVKNAPNAEIYQPSKQEWINAFNTIVDLHSPSPFGCLTYPPDNTCYFPPGEIGPAILRPDGTVFATGSYTNNNVDSTAHTAIYDTHTATWTVGPSFPITNGVGDNAGDNFAVLLPNGNVLVEGQHGWGYEFDGTHFQLTTTDYLGSLMVLPTGEVLADGSLTYQSTGTYNKNWAPAIHRVSSKNLAPGATYRIWGTQFNGLSQAQAFGDEDQAATNYPLVRITNTASHHVFYARTHDHSSMGVATGALVVSTYFDVPAGIEKGASTLVVVANGIPSAPIAVTAE